MSLPSARMLDDGTIVVTPEIDLFCERLEVEFHVHPDIIARVRRLNPNLRPGQLARGLHRKEGRWWGYMQGHMQRCEFIRRFGREAFDRLAADRIVKRGRRIWVRHPRR